MTGYDIGDLVRIYTGEVFTNDAGTATDPTAVTLTIRRPDGTTTTLVYGVDVTLERAGEGSYYSDVTPAAGEEGVWWYRWVGTGDVQAADERSFYVRPSRVL